MSERFCTSRTVLAPSDFRIASLDESPGESKRGFPGNTRYAIRAPDFIAPYPAPAAISHLFGRCAIQGGQPILLTGYSSNVRMPVSPGHSPREIEELRHAAEQLGEQVSSQRHSQHPPQ